jgi:hypothetical protein
MGRYAESAVRFSELNIQNFFYLQAEIIALQEMRELEKANKRSPDPKFPTEQHFPEIGIN